MPESFEGKAPLRNESTRENISNTHSGARSASRGGRFKSAKLQDAKPQAAKRLKTKAQATSSSPRASNGSTPHAPSTSPKTIKEPEDRPVFSRTCAGAGGYMGYSIADAQKNSNRHRVLAIVIGIAVLLAAVAAIYFGYSFLNKNTNTSAQITPGIKIEITISSGAGAISIAKQLKGAGVISKENVFVAAAEARGTAFVPKVGSYLLITGMSNDEIIDLLIAGPSNKKLTIPEGLTLEQTAAVVEEACGVPKDGFITEAYSADKYYSENPQKYWFLASVYNNSLEGFLYPKTYMIPDGADAPKIIRTLLDQFAIETAKLDMSYAQSKNLTIYDVMIIASMVERETYTAGERDKVSSVIYNRLSSGMKLQICATVVYALGSDSRDYGVNPLLYVDLDVDSPYNTYLHDGLPPGPICSPQIASITAAAHPAQSNYLYYVLTSTDGTHTFCATDEEFAAANARYQEVFG